MKKTVKISPEGFERVRATLIDLENRGFGPDACAFGACNFAGLYPEIGDEIMFVVDPNLHGPVWPFMDGPSTQR